MLSITKDLETQNGIKASRHKKDLAFLTPDNIEEVYQKLMAYAPPIIKTHGKYSLIFSSPLKLIDCDGNALDIDGKIIYHTGKYFIIYNEVCYKIIDSNGNTLFDDISDIVYVGGIISLRDKKSKQDFIVTQNTIITLPINKADIVASNNNGCYFIKDKEKNCYTVYNSFGEFLETGIDLDELKKRFEQEVSKESLIDITLYEKVLIKEFQKHPELQAYNASNLLEMLAASASLDIDFYIDLYKVKVNPTKFTHLLKLSDGKHELWIPDTEEERKIMEEFCLDRRRK